MQPQVWCPSRAGAWRGRWWGRPRPVAGTVCRPLWGVTCWCLPEGALVPVGWGVQWGAGVRVVVGLAWSALHHRALGVEVPPCLSSLEATRPLGPAWALVALLMVLMVVMGVAWAAVCLGPALAGPGRCPLLRKRVSPLRGTRTVV